MSYISTECFYPDFQAIMLIEQLKREIAWVSQCKFLAAGYSRIHAKKSAGTGRPSAIKAPKNFWLGSDRRWG